MNFLKPVITVFILFYLIRPAVCQPHSYNQQPVHVDATVNAINCTHLPADFKVDFNACNQNQIDFSNNSLDAVAVAWNFGDGNTGNGGETVSHIYTAEGVYNAMLAVQNSTGCTDTIYKRFILSIDKGNIFTDKFLNVCKDIAFRISGDSNAVENCWSPTTYLNSTSVQDPVCTPLNNVAYKYNTITRGRQVIDNGDFSQGNGSFSSDYNYSSTINSNGHYFVGPKPRLWNPAYQNCFIPPNINGDTMLIVNGATTPNLAVWETTVNVVPNTNYAFGFFGQSLAKTDSVVLDISINAGELIGRVRLPNQPCNRKRFNTSWYSGANSSVHIKITDLDTNAVNNDFALDTISLRAVYLNTDSIYVTLIPPPAFSVQPLISTICPGDSVLLTASGGDAYAWFPQAGVRQPFSNATYAVPSSTTNYKAVITENTCNVKDSVFATVNVSSPPAITISKSNDIDCAKVQSTLNASGGVSYQWTPSNTLSDANIPNPVASPQDTTVYHVLVTDAIGCRAEDSIQVLVLKTKPGNDYLVPNAFTPNNDGLNDCFSIRKWGSVANLEFAIYNRWGKIIFHTSDFSKCWDGMYKSLPQPAGAYIYLIKGNTPCGNIVRKGTVVLIR